MVALPGPSRDMFRRQRQWVELCQACPRALPCCKAASRAQEGFKCPSSVFRCFISYMLNIYLHILFHPSNGLGGGSAFARFTETTKLCVFCFAAFIKHELLFIPAVEACVKSTWLVRSYSACLCPHFCANPLLKIPTLSKLHLLNHREGEIGL